MKNSIVLLLDFEHLHNSADFIEWFTLNLEALRNVEDFEGFEGLCVLIRVPKKFYINKHDSIRTCVLRLLIWLNAESKGDSWPLHKRDAFVLAQQSLCNLYYIAIEVLESKTSPLFNIEILFDGLCQNISHWEGQPLCIVAADCTDTTGFIACSDNMAYKVDLMAVEALNAGHNENGILPLASVPDGYSHSVLGGTFDHLHVGHKLLLSVALLVSKGRVTCGVTAQSMLLEKKYVEYIESESVRLKGVEKFMQKFQKACLELDILRITDAFGTTITDPSCEVLIGTPETESGCLAVEAKREELNLPPLDIILVSLVIPASSPDSNPNDKVSSTFIRHYLVCKNRSM